MTGTGELRVLFVNHTADVSGAEISLLELLTALPRDVRPAVCSPFGTLTRSLPSDVPAYELPTAAAGARLAFRTTPRELGSMALAVNQLRHVIKDFTPHIIHANSIRAGLVSAALGRRRAPLVVHVRDVLPRHALSRVVRRVLLRRAEAIVANSQYTLREFLAGNATDGVVARSVHNPIDFVRLEHTSRRHDLREEFGIAPEASVLVHVAQITPWKAQDDSVRIVKRLRDDGLDAHLLIAGEARFSGTGAAAANQRFVKDLRELVRSLHVDDAVHFLGWRDDVACVYRAADLAILPSVNEPFGRAVAEAMAFGIPVAATSVGGTTEILRDGIDGLLIPPRSPDDWARRIAGLLGADDERRTMGHAAAEHIHATFGPTAHAEAIVDVYRELAAA